MSEIPEEVLCVGKIFRPVPWYSFCELYKDMVVRVSTAAVLVQEIVWKQQNETIALFPTVNG